MTCHPASARSASSAVFLVADHHQRRLVRLARAGLERGDVVRRDRPPRRRGRDALAARPARRAAATDPRAASPRAARSPPSPRPAVVARRHVCEAEGLRQPRHRGVEPPRIGPAHHHVGAVASRPAGTDRSRTRDPDTPRPAPTAAPAMSPSPRSIRSDWLSSGAPPVSRGRTRPPSPGRSRGHPP